MTNADRIRKMSNYDLCNFLVNLTHECEYRSCCHQNCTGCEVELCNIESCKKWLEKEEIDK